MVAIVRLGIIVLRNRVQQNLTSYRAERSKPPHRVKLTLTTGSQQHMQGRCGCSLELNLTVIMQKAGTSPRKGVGQNLIQTDHCKHCLNFF